MTTDYVLFVHGVKNRDSQAFERTSLALLQAIQRSLNQPGRSVKPIFLFWGDLNVQSLKNLAQGLERSPQWKKLLFRDFRTREVLEFVGDAALYLSRHVGSEVVYRIKETALGPLEQAQAGDRLHLITHSMGTVILFDILFAGRWEDPRLDQSASTQNVRPIVSAIRNALFGMGKDPSMGLPVASIHTMGSPIALFSLLTETGDSSHDLTANLKDLLQNLYHHRSLHPLIWNNFIHPGDPIAYPLQGIWPELLGNAQLYVSLRDVLTENRNLPINIGLVPLLWGGDAHGSYWQSQRVAQSIADALR